MNNYDIPLSFPEFPVNKIKFPSYGGYIDIPLIPEYSTREEGISCSLKGIYIKGPKSIPVYDLWTSTAASSESFQWPLPSNSTWENNGCFTGIDSVNKYIESLGEVSQLPDWGYHLCITDYEIVEDRFPNPKYIEDFCTPFSGFCISLPGNRDDNKPYARFYVDGINRTDKTYSTLTSTCFSIFYNGQVNGTQLTIEQLPPKQLIFITGFYNGACFQGSVGCGPLTPLTYANSCYYCNEGISCATLRDYDFSNTYTLNSNQFGELYLRPSVGPLIISSYTKSYTCADESNGYVYGDYNKTYTTATLCGACDPVSFDDLNTIKWLNIYKDDCSGYVSEFLSCNFPLNAFSYSYFNVLAKSDQNAKIYVDGKEETLTSSWCLYSVSESLTFCTINSSGRSLKINMIGNLHSDDTDFHNWDSGDFEKGDIIFLNLTSSSADTYGNTESNDQLNAFYCIYKPNYENYYSGKYYTANCIRAIEQDTTKYFNTKESICYVGNSNTYDSYLGFNVYNISDQCGTKTVMMETSSEYYDINRYNAGLCFNSESFGTCFSNISKYCSCSKIKYEMNNITGSSYGGYLMWYNSPRIGTEKVYNSNYPSGCCVEEIYTHATGSLIQIKVDDSYTGENNGGVGNIPSDWPVCTPCIYIGPNCGQRLYYGNKLVQEAYWNEEKVWWA